MTESRVYTAQDKMFAIADHSFEVCAFMEVKSIGDIMKIEVAFIKVLENRNLDNIKFYQCVSQIKIGKISKRCPNIQH